MFSICKKILACGTAAIIALPSLASAEQTVSHYTGSWDGINVEYNPSTQDFSMDYSNNANAQKSDINAWWLVVTDGPVPDQSAIQLIGDMDAGIITAYTYQGAGADNFDTHGQYLDTFNVGNIDDGFELNVADLNDALEAINPNGFKIEISEEAGAGIWMKGANGTPVYNQDGSIAEWATGDGNYHIYDKRNLEVSTVYQSNPVSEPAAALALLVAAGAVRLRRKKNA